VGLTCGGPAEAETANYYYDLAGRLTGVVDSATGTASYTLDAAGNVKSITWHSTLFIGGFAPAHGLVGTSVTIGGNFGSATSSNTSVKINGTPATLTNVTATALTVMVPAGASTGPVSVTIGTSSYTTPSTLVFTVPVTAPAPTITSLSPTTILAPGSSFTVNGSNFVPGNTLVTLNGQIARVTAASSTQLTVAIPPLNASTGHITISTPNGTVTSAGYVILPPPGYSTGQIATTAFTNIGAAASVTSGSAGYEQLIFDVAAGQSVFASLTNDTNVNDTFLIFGPQGVSLGSANAGRLFLPTGSLPPGSYTLLFLGGSGTIKPQLQPAPVTSSFTFGATSWPSLTVTPGQLAEMSFNATAGQRVFVFTPDTASNLNAIYFSTLVDPFGNIIYNSASTSTSDSMSIALTLVSSGTYTWVGYYLGIYFMGNPGTVSAIPNFAFTPQIYLVPPDSVQALTSNGAPVSFTETVPGQQATFTFNGTVGQRVNTSNWSNVNDLYSDYKWYVVDPNGNIIYTNTSNGPSASGVLTLTTPGTYSIVNPTLWAVYEPSLGLGSVSTALWNVPTDTTQALTPQTPASISLVPGQKANFTFSSTTVNQAISLAYPQALGQYSVSLTGPTGAVALTPSSPNLIEDLTLPSTGSYTLTFTGGVPSLANDVQSQQYGQATGTVTLYLVPATVSGTINANGSTVTVPVTGPGQQIQLTTNVSQAAITAKDRLNLYIQVNGNLTNFQSCNSTDQDCASFALADPSGMLLDDRNPSGSYYPNLPYIADGPVPISGYGVPATRGLSQAGNYSITFSETPVSTSAGAESGETGNAVFTLFSVPPDVWTTLSVPGAATYGLVAPGQAVVVDFTATSASHTVTVTAGTLGPYADVSIFGFAYGQADKFFEAKMSGNSSVVSSMTPYVIGDPYRIIVTPYFLPGVNTFSTMVGTVSIAVSSP
jgi:YD repeat-containing protein